MTPDFELSAGAASGTLSGSTDSPTFRPGVSPGFTVTLQFSADAVGTVALLRTLDNGATWVGRMAGPNDLTTFAARGGVTTTAEVLEFDPTVIYRFRSNLSAGSVTCRAVQSGHTRNLGVIGALPGNMNEAGTVVSAAVRLIGFPLRSTAQQRASLLASLWTPLLDADISGTLTGYKVLESDLIAKLSIPASAQRCRSQSYRLGLCRAVRAEYADIVSIVNYEGRNVAGGASTTFPAFRYTAGQRAVALNQTGESTGAFTDSTYRAGIHFVPTLAEAVSLVAQRMPTIDMNLAAFGL